MDETEANSSKRGYVDDLEQEGAQQIRVVVKHCKAPNQLTIYDEAADSTDSSGEGFSTPAFSGQP